MFTPLQSISSVQVGKTPLAFQSSFSAALLLRFVPERKEVKWMVQQVYTYCWSG
jgi:hypothetical protein